MASVARPAVKRTYGSRKPLATYTRPLSSSSAPSSEWDNAIASSSSVTTDAPITPPTSPEMNRSTALFDDEPSSSGVLLSGEGRQLRPRSPPSKLSLDDAPKLSSKESKPRSSSTGLLGFFKRVSPPRRKRSRSSSFPSHSDNDDDLLPLPSLATRKPKSTSSYPTEKKQKLEQLFLDPFETAGHSTLSCAVCNLSYAQTPEDKALHKKHHAKVVGGCDWVVSEKEGDKVTVIDEGVEWGSNRGGRIVMVNASVDGALGNRVKDVLQTIDRELSATSLTPPQLATAKLILFLTPQRKVLACAVAERITGAYQVTSSSSIDEFQPSLSQEERDGLLRFGEQEGAVFCSPTLLPTLIGIHRIWTSSSHRHHGLASQLLTAVAQNFIYGCPISSEKRKIDVAFSQPTGAGMGLARRWTGTEGFRVFVD